MLDDLENMPRITEILLGSADTEPKPRIWLL